MKKLFVACILSLGIIASASPVKNKHFDLSKKIKNFLNTKKINDIDKFILVESFKELKQNQKKLEEFKLNKNIEEIFKLNIIWALTAALDNSSMPDAVSSEILIGTHLDTIIKKLKKASKIGCDLILPKTAIIEVANEFLEQLSVSKNKKQLTMHKTLNHTSLCRICHREILDSHAWSDTGHRYAPGKVHDACLSGLTQLVDYSNQNHHSRL